MNDIKCIANCWAFQVLLAGIVVFLIEIKKLNMQLKISKFVSQLLLVIQRICGS